MNMPKNMVETDFSMKLEYSCDIFEKLYAMNLALQGSNIHILIVIETVLAFINKLQIWGRK